jgi:hypothetical protein
MENIIKFIALINNRMYGDYYKLYNIIILQCAQFNIDTQDIAIDAKKYTPYRDLDQYHEYDLDNIIQLHRDILSIINQLLIYSGNKEQNITQYTDTNNIGISIVNFINTLEYENTLLREQITLYVNYVGFFHNSHTCYLTKLHNKIKGFYSEIEDDIMNNTSEKTRLKIYSNDIVPSKMLNIHPLENNGLYSVLQSGSNNSDSKIQPLPLYNSLFTQETSQPEGIQVIPDIMNQDIQSTDIQSTNINNLVDENIGILLEPIDTPNL